MSNSKKVAILQSNYLPWKGYFDIIHDVDDFIFYDEVQFTHNDWRNRNKIKTKDGLQWISVPVGRHMNQSIDEVAINIPNWQAKHFNAIRGSYAKAPFFKKYKPFFEHIYFEKKWNYLFELNRYLIIHIAQNFLNIQTTFHDSRSFQVTGDKNQRLIHLITACNANQYISGPTAKNYMDVETFQKHNIKIIWKSYDDYPEYPQLFGPFEHYVSVIDILFNIGDNAPHYIWGHRK